MVDEGVNQFIIFYQNDYASAQSCTACWRNFTSSPNSNICERPFFLCDGNGCRLYYVNTKKLSPSLFANKQVWGSSTLIRPEIPPVSISVWSLVCLSESTLCHPLWTGAKSRPNAAGQRQKPPQRCHTIAFMVNCEQKRCPFSLSSDHSKLKWLRYAIYVWFTWSYALSSPIG